MENSHGTPEPAAGSAASRAADLVRGVSWAQTFAALRHPNYKLWFWSQMFSMFGSWMESTALGFFIFEMTRSSAYLGLVGFAAGVPTWIFMLYAGVIADRVPRRSIIIVTQIAMMLLAFGLAAMTFTGAVRPWHILVMAFLLGIANAFEAPARLAFILEMVAPRDLTNAIALNSAMFNTATALGPAAAGLIYAALGPAWCFTVNGVSFIPVILALRIMKLPAFVPRPRTGTTLQELKAGLRYVAGHRLIRTITLGVGFMIVFGMSFVTLIPAWAGTVLRGDARTNGWLQSARGLGALAGALFIAALGAIRFRRRLLSLGMIALPLILTAFVFVRWLPLSLGLLFAAGFAIILVLNLSNVLIQTSTPDDMRGRVMGVYSFVFFGFMPFGALWIGAVAEKIGEPAAVLIGAGIAFAAMMFVRSRAKDLRLSDHPASSPAPSAGGRP
jgi:MFS family permease